MFKAHRTRTGRKDEQTSNQPRFKCYYTCLQDQRPVTKEEVKQQQKTTETYGTHFKQKKHTPERGLEDSNIAPAFGFSAVFYCLW